MQNERMYQLALTLVPELGVIRAKALLDRFGTAAAIFRAKKKELASTEGIGEISAGAIKTWNDFARAEAELRFIESHQIRPVFITDENYPQRLLHCYDPPVMLYYKGNASLNSSRILSIIGTRNPTEYGKQATEQLIHSLAGENICVVSGLALGIDALAHKTALQHGMNTLAVLGHGLDTIYPWQNRNLAKEITAQGGLLTEFRSHTQPDKHNFPRRNRIVAGMADATIVIETASKGGSMITAELTWNYNRDLFALPGRTTDPKSSGCLQLIQQQKALLLTGAAQLLETMGWQEKKKIPVQQRTLFAELTGPEQKILALLEEKGNLPIDAIYLHCGLNSSTAAAAMLNLEMLNLVTALPGKMYRLV